MVCLTTWLSLRAVELEAILDGLLEGYEGVQVQDPHAILDIIDNIIPVSLLESKLLAFLG